MHRCTKEFITGCVTDCYVTELIASALPLSIPPPTPYLSILAPSVYHITARGVGLTGHLVVVALLSEDVAL